MTGDNLTPKRRDHVGEAASYNGPALVKKEENLPAPFAQQQQDRGHLLCRPPKLLKLGARCTAAVPNSVGVERKGQLRRPERESQREREREQGIERERERWE